MHILSYNYSRKKRDTTTDVLASISLILAKWLRLALLQTRYRRNCECLKSSISIPTERIIHQLPFKRKQFHFRHGYVCARHRITAGEVYRRVSDVVRTLYVWVWYVGYKHCWCLVHACFGQAVILVYNDAVPHVLHYYAVKGDAWYWAHASLPCLDPDSIVRIFNHRIPDSNVRYTCLWIVHTQASNAAYTVWYYKTDDTLQYNTTHELKLFCVYLYNTWCRGWVHRSHSQCPHPHIRDRWKCNHHLWNWKNKQR